MKGVFKKKGTAIFNLFVLSLILSFFVSCGVATVSLRGLDITDCKTEYVVGERFDPSGMTVKAVYGDGSMKEISDYTFFPDGKLTEADEEVIIEYTEGGKTVRKAIDISVSPAQSLKYRMEAESAAITGNGGLTPEIQYGHPAATNLMYFDPVFSGNILMMNTGGLKFTFRFTSDRTTTANLYLYIGVADYVGGSLYGQNLSDYIEIKNNGAAAGNADPIPDEDSAEGTIPPLDLSMAADKLPEFEADYYMVYTRVSISVAEGENTLTVEMIGNSVKFDYIELESKAKISGFVPESYASPESFVSFSKMPTQFKKGELKFYDNAAGDLNYAPKTYALPTLPNCQKDADGDYVVEICGKTFKVGEREISHTLTIAGTDVSFADGTNVKSAGVNSVIPEVTVAEGKVLKGWTFEDKFYNADAFVMPDKDATIVPVFAQKYTLTLGGGALIDGKDSVTVTEGAPLPTVLTADFGKGELVVKWRSSSGEEYGETGNLVMPSHNITLTPETTRKSNVTSGCGSIKIGAQKTVSAKNFDKKGKNIQFGETAEGVSAAAKTITTYETEDGAEALAFYVKGVAGGSTRIKTYYSVKAGTTYYVEYALKNYGDTEIKLRLSQINTGETALEETTREVTVGAGERVTVGITFCFGSSNGNMLLYFGLSQDIATATKITLSAAVYEGYRAAEKI